MDSRERTFLAIERQQPDRIPIDFWASTGFTKKLQATLNGSLEDFLDRHDVDLRYIEGPRYAGPPLASPAPDLSVDIWGVVRRTVVLNLDGWPEYYKEVHHAPLAGAKSVEEIHDYPHWPRADWFRYDLIEAQCGQIHRRGRVAVFQGDRLNRVAQLKPAMYLRGVEQILVDLALNPEIAEAIFTKVREFYLAYLERILAAGRGKIDVVLTGDDFGSQRAPLISPAMWERFLRRGFAQYLDLIRSGGARTMHHTCGSVAEIIPAMLDCGLDVLQSLQPEAQGMSPEALKDRFGDRLAFHGGVSIQQTLPFGTPDDVRREVERLAHVLGRGGGYIFCTAHNIQADTPVRNAQTLLDSYREYGAYG